MKSRFSAGQSYCVLGVIGDIAGVEGSSVKLLEGVGAHCTINVHILCIDFCSLFVVLLGHLLYLK